LGEIEMQTIMRCEECGKGIMELTKIQGDKLIFTCNKCKNTETIDRVKNIGIYYGINPGEFPKFPKFPEIPKIPEFPKFPTTLNPKDGKIIYVYERSTTESDWVADVIDKIEDIKKKIRRLFKWDYT
jgi:ssDNA-binding Zn-finger/Zn-ribbon topoisomerase 1